MNRRTLKHTTLILVIALAGALALVACGSDSDDGDNGSETTTSTTTPADTTTTTTEPAAPPAAIWPAADADPLATDTDAALGFAREFLGMPDASLADDTDAVSGAVGIRPYADRGPTTFVEVDEREGGWVVTGASTEYVIVNDPLPGQSVSTPVTVSGSATASEGNIRLEARPLAVTAALASTFATAGAQGEMGPFEATLEFQSGDDVVVIVVFLPDESGDATMLAATAFPVALATG